MGLTYAQTKGRESRPARRTQGGYKGGAFATFETFGIPELDRLFKQLSDSQRRNIIVAAWRKASKPMIAEIKGDLTATVGRVSGNLYKSIGASPVRGRAQLNLGARRFVPWAGFHAHLINDGTVERYTESGAHRGAVAGTKFFDMAVNATKQQVVDDFRNGQIEVFHKFIVRANKRKKT